MNPTITITNGTVVVSTPEASATITTAHPERAAAVLADELRAAGADPVLNPAQSAA